jgi:hypothetical protein
MGGRRRPDCGQRDAAHLHQRTKSGGQSRFRRAVGLRAILSFLYSATRSFGLQAPRPAETPEYHASLARSRRCLSGGAPRGKSRDTPPPPRTAMAMASNPRAHADSRLCASVSNAANNLAIRRSAASTLSCAMYSRLQSGISGAARGRRTRMDANPAVEPNPDQSGVSACHPVNHHRRQAPVRSPSQRGKM